MVDAKPGLQAAGAGGEDGVRHAHVEAGALETDLVPAGGSAESKSGAKRGSDAGLGSYFVGLFSLCCVDV